MFKYPRTSHVRGSRFQHGDDDLEAVPWEELAGKRLVVEEKVDGSNCGISFDEDGTLLLQSRGHYLRGGPRERQFDILKQWAASRQEELFSMLGSRYVMYGENLTAKHTYFYDALPHYFMEFDVLDTHDGWNVFLDTPSRDKLLRFASDIVCPVRVVKAGVFNKLSELEDLITRSNFITDSRHRNLVLACAAAKVNIGEALTHTDMDERMEGLYIKWEDQGVVKGRYKFVRGSFTSAILDQETHWHDRPIINNRLVDGGLERMFA